MLLNSDKRDLNMSWCLTQSYYHISITFLESAKNVIDVIIGYLLYVHQYNRSISCCHQSYWLSPILLIYIGFLVSLTVVVFLELYQLHCIIINTYTLLYIKSLHENTPYICYEPLLQNHQHISFFVIRILTCRASSFVDISSPP